LFLEDYQRLCKFFINSTQGGQFGLDKLLGFNSPNAIIEGDDRLVSKQEIKNGLEKYIYECDDDFLDHIVYSGCT